MMPRRRGLDMCFDTGFWVQDSVYASCYEVMVSFSRAQQGESSERTVVHSRAILDSRNRPPVPFLFPPSPPSLPRKSG